MTLKEVEKYKLAEFVKKEFKDAGKDCQNFDIESEIDSEITYNENKAILQKKINHLIGKIEKTEKREYNEMVKAEMERIEEQSKLILEKELEKVIASYGIEDIEAWNKLKDEEKPDLTETTEKELAKLYLYKTLGKGVKAWFDEKVIHKDGKLHPRFVFTGASTMRMSMSRPNCFSGDTEILTKEDGFHLR